MGMEQATAATTLAASPAASDAGLTLAGLIDVLDRADAVPVHRPRPRRSAAYRTTYRPPSARPVADRWDPMRTVGPRTATPVRPGSARPAPLRSVQPAPAARIPTPTSSVRAPAPEARPSVPAPVGHRAAVARLRGLLRGLARRAALWGAGPGGAHLAWGGATPRSAYRADARPADPPVVLREMPSTPTIRPAASSPAAAPRATAPLSGPRWHPPEAAATPASRRLLARSPAASPVTSPSGPLGLPESRARAPAGIRGSPGTPLPRGSPPGWPDTG
jgi:hypothetical protein